MTSISNDPTRDLNTHLSSELRARGSGWDGVHEVWRYRELLRSLVVRNMKAKYQRSVLGFFWTLLNPLLTVSILTVVFSYVVRIHLTHYWAFLLSGYFVWNFILQTISSGTYVLIEHAQLSRSVAFPKELLVLASVISRLVEFGIELTLVLVGLALFHYHTVPLSFLCVPWLIALQFLLSLGLMFPIATLSVFYHDVQHALPIVLTMLFYITPIFYPASMVPGAMRPFYALNPVARLLSLYHEVLYDGRLPGASALLTMTGVALLVVWLGFAIFNRYKALYAEIL